MELLIGELARRTDLNRQTVKYYERRGLLLPVQRKASGYRMYNEESLKRLRFIKQAQELGFALAEIGELLKLRSSSSAATCSKAAKKAENKLKQVEKKMQQLKKMASVLETLISKCHQREPSEPCPLLECCEAKP